MDLLHSLSVGDVLREHRRSHPHRLASVFGERRLTYPQLDERVNRLADALRRRGFRSGDRALWLGQNSDRLLEVLLAAAKLGGHFCPVNWRLTPDEMVFVLEDAAPSIVFWQEQEIGDAVRAALERAGPSEARVQTDAAAGDPYEALLAEGDPRDPELPVDPASPLLQMYTASFGGTPNGALLSHRAIIAQSLVLAWIDQKSSDEIYLVAGPLFHMGPFMFSMSVFQCAGTLVFVRRVVAEELCQVIERERCTDAYILGPTVDQILEVNRDGRYDLSSLKSLPVHRPELRNPGAVPRAPWRRRPGGFGQTEIMGMATFNAIGGDCQGVSGRPSPFVQLRILDEAGGELPPGEVGEIAVRGPTVMNGYFRRPELNEARQRGGWHRTHDLGRREADGSLSFIGPKARMIKSAAENIYPVEVERCIASHPAVAACAVIGVPDPVWVQSVKAIVQLAEGQTLSAEAVIAHCRERIASYKKPRFVEFVDALPRRGPQVDYAALDRQFGGGAYPGGTTRSA